MALGGPHHATLGGPHHVTLVDLIMWPTMGRIHYHGQEGG